MLPALLGAGDRHRTVSPELLLAVAVGAATRAGRLLLAASEQTHDVSTKTSATDPVTEADRASEELITAALRDARPDDAILGEEGADTAGTSGLRWVIDPLDGTVNYLYGIAAWAVSIACEDGDGTVIGVVHNPSKGETFTAIRGQGSWLNGRELRVRDPVALEEALLATGFGYGSEDRERQAAVVAKVLPRARDIRRIGSAALDLCNVAAGRVDGYYEDLTHRWDWAAGALVAVEAGAQLRAYGQGVAVAGPALMAELVEVLDLH